MVKSVGYASLPRQWFSWRTLAAGSILTAGAALWSLVGCQTGVLGGANPSREEVVQVPVNSGPVDVSPETTSAESSLVDIRESLPDSEAAGATMALLPADVLVEAEPGANGNRLDGTVEVVFRLATTESTAPCTTEPAVASFSMQVVDGLVVSVEPPLAVLDAGSLEILTRGTFILCIDLASTFPGTVTIQQLELSFQVGDGGATPTGDGGVGANDNGSDDSSDDNANDNADDDNANDNADDDADDDNTNDNADDDAADDNANDNSTGDDTNENDNESE